MTTKTKKPQILLVDDDMDFQYILRQWLKSRYETISLSSGEELLDEVRSLDPDLIILDVRLPGPDGFKLCRRIRSDSRFAGTPILFLTASHSNEDFIKNLEVGGTAYITKPVERQRLLAEIHQLLSAP